MPKKVCQIKKGEQNCAHHLSKAFEDLFPFLMDGNGIHQTTSNGYMRCGCGAMLREKQVRSWAQKNGNKVAKLEKIGTFIIFQYKHIQGGGHVWGCHDFQCYGNDYYNGFVTKEMTHQEIYQVFPEED